jgi:hypothetical protein
MLPLILRIDSFKRIDFGELIFLQYYEKLTQGSILFLEYFNDIIFCHYRHCNRLLGNLLYRLLLSVNVITSISMLFKSATRC